MYTPPGVPRSRSLTRFTMRVGLEHFGQSVLLLVSMTFFRSPVLAIFAILLHLPCSARGAKPASPPYGGWVPLSSPEFT